MFEKPVKAFELVAGSAALDLVNTLDFRFRAGGEEEQLGSYDDLLGFLTQSKLISEARGRRLRHSAGLGDQADQVLYQVLLEVRALREAIGVVAYALLEGRKVPAACLATLQQSFESAAAERRLVVEGAQLTWSWQDALAQPAVPLWLLAQAAADFFLSGEPQQLRSCAGESCRWLFLDTSKNHSRRWCAMSVCGNRMKAKRFQERQKQD